MSNRVVLARCAVALLLVTASLLAKADVQVPAHQRLVLANGITLVLMPQHDVPLISYAALLRGGAATDPPGKAGIASLYAGLLEKGAGGRDAYAFAEAVEGAGGSFDAGADQEAVAIRGQFLARDRALLLALLSDAILRPRLDPVEFETLRKRQMEFIKAGKDSNPNAIIDNFGRAFLFGSHPYGSPVAGSEHSLAGISLSDIHAFQRDQLGADRLTLVFTGDFDAAWLQQAVANAFGGLARAKKPVAALPQTTPVKGRRVLLIDAPAAVQTYFWLANVGVSRHFPQRATLDIVNTLYGGRFSSILNSELRIKSGLTYGASSGFRRGSVAGEFAIGSFTQTENTVKAIDLALATLDTLHRDGVSAAMIDSSRSYVAGQYPTRLETAAHWAGVFADLELYGLGPEYINDYGPALKQVSPQDARAIISSTYPASQDLVMVLIGDAAKIRSGVAKYGPVTEMPFNSDEYWPKR